MTEGQGGRAVGEAPGVAGPEQDPEHTGALSTPAQLIRVAADLVQAIDTIKVGVMRLEDGMQAIRTHAAQLGHLSHRLRQAIANGGGGEDQGPRSGRLPPSAAPLSPWGGTGLSGDYHGFPGVETGGTGPQEVGKVQAGKAAHAENARRHGPIAQARARPAWTGPLRAVRWWTSSHRTRGATDPAGGYERPTKRRK